MGSRSLQPMEIGEEIMKLGLIQELGKEKIDESVSDDLDSLKAQINNMSRFGESFASIKEEFRVNEGETFVKLAEKIIALTTKIRQEQ